MTAAFLLTLVPAAARSEGADLEARPAAKAMSLRPRSLEEPRGGRTLESWLRSPYRGPTRTDLMTFSARQVPPYRLMPPPGRLFQGNIEEEPLPQGSG